MKTKQTAEPEQKVDPEPSKGVTPNEKIDIPDDKSEEDVSLDKGNILKRIWTYVVQNPVGTSGWAVAAVMFLTFVCNFARNIRLSFR